MANIEIRELIRSRRLHNYEVAKALGVAEATLSRWLRYELPEEKKNEIIEVIAKIK